MKLDHKISLNRTLLLALVAGGLLFLLTTAVGCGDDDDDGAAGSDGSAAGEEGSDGSAAGADGADGAAGEEGSDGSAAGADGTAGAEAGAGGEPAPPATAEQKQAACQCLFDVGTLPLESLIDVCAGNVSDECVACLEGVTGGSSCEGMDETAISDCTIDCMGIIPPPADAAECIEWSGTKAATPEILEVHTCMCNNCLDLYGPCIVNPGCQRIMICAAETGCDATTCISDPVCSVVITEVGAIPDAVFLALPAGQCAAEQGCQGTPPAADAGVDSGADGG